MQYQTLFLKWWCSPSRAKRAPEGFVAVGFPQKCVVFSPHLILCVIVALCSAFLFPESSSLQLFPAVRRAVEQRELNLFLLCSDYRLGNKWGSPVCNLLTDKHRVRELICPWSHRLTGQPGCFWKHAVALISCLLQCKGHKGMQQAPRCLAFPYKEN